MDNVLFKFLLIGSSTVCLRAKALVFYAGMVMPGILLKCLTSMVILKSELKCQCHRIK